MIVIEIGQMRITCDTPQEAAQVAKLLGGAALAPVQRDLPLSTPSSEKVFVVHGASAGSTSFRNPWGDAEKFVRAVWHHQGASLTSLQLAEALGLEDPKGIGPYLGHMRKRFTALKVPVGVDQMLEKHGKPPGPSEWRIRKLNYDALLDALMAGQEGHAP